MAPVDDDPMEAADEGVSGRPPAVGAEPLAAAEGATDGEAARPSAAGHGPSPAGEIAALPWDDDLPLALGEETALAAPAPGETQGGPADDENHEGPGEPQSGHEGHDGDAHGEAFDYGDDGDLSYDDLHGRRSAPATRRESWRTRSATGAIATALAMGLQQVFEPEKKRPAAVAEAPSDPYSDDDPITVDYLPDDAGGTKVHVKPWLLQKEDPA